MRKERNFKAGTRVRIDAPGWGCHGKVGIVERDTLTPAHPVAVILGSGKISHTASFEVSRLRDQAGREQALADALERRRQYCFGPIAGTRRE